MADTAAQFDRLFTAALPKTGVGDTKPKKEQERDYEQLHKFVLGLKEPKPLDSCTDTYLRIYEKYSPTDPRSKQVFVILLERRIKYAPSGDAIFDELHKRLREKQYPPSPIYVRFHSLDDHNQAEIYKLLDEARRAGALLDELRQAYLKAYGFAAKSFDDLYNFDPQRDDALQKQLQALMDECKRAWGKAQDFSPENWEKFRASFQTFGDFIKQHGGNTLTLFQLLKWTWDPFHVHYKSGARGRERYQQPFGDVDVELYLRIVIALLIRGANVKAGNLRGFTDEEHRFFFEPLAEQYYFPDYKNRFRIATSGRGNIQAFYDLALAHLQLLRYAKAKNAVPRRSTLSF